MSHSLWSIRTEKTTKIQVNSAKYAVKRSGLIRLRQIKITSNFKEQKMSNPDWYPTKKSEQLTMYTNVLAKIDNYVAKYGLATSLVDNVKLMCNTFIACYQKIEQNKATMKDMNEWFEKILTAKSSKAASPAPVFQTITLPVGAFTGIEGEFRKFAEFFKNNPVYDRNDGVDLMIVAPESEEDDLSTVAPELKYTIDASGAIEFAFKKGEFELLELQYRKAGATMWQAADKSNKSPIKFTPSLSAAGTPEKFEFCAVYLIKNERVGQWSAIYEINVG